MNNKQNSQPQQEDNIDIKKYLQIGLKNWHWFVLSCVICLTIAWIVNRYTQPVFQVSTTILVNEDNEKKSIKSGSEMIQTLNMLGAGVNLQNQIGLLQSYLLNEQAVSELELGVGYHRIGRVHTIEMYLPAELKITIDTSHVQDFSTMFYLEILSREKFLLKNEKYGINKEMRFGDTYEDDFYKFTVDVRDPNYEPELDDLGKEKFPKYNISFNPQSALINNYKSKIKIEQTDLKSTILKITSTGYVPNEVCDYLNKLTEVYIRYGLNQKNNIILNTIKFIDEQINSIVDSLDITGGSLQDFRTNNMIININQEGQLLYKQYEDLNTQKAELMVEQKYYDYITNYLNDKQDGQAVIVPTAVGIHDQLLINFIMRLNTLNEEQMALKAQSVKSNPKLDLINSQIDGLKLLISENVNNLTKTNSIAIKDIDGRIVEISKQIEKLPSNERQLMNIHRKFDINDQIYTYLLEKRAEAGLKQAANTSDAQILDYARPEQAQKISPKTKIYYAIALIMGLAIPVGIIILVSFFNNKIICRKDIEDHTDAPILGTIGHNEDSSELIIFDKPRSIIAESFRTIKTNIQYLLLNDGSKTIAVTSTLSGEGKSFCASNLASIMAMTNKKTLLLGLDLRKPQIHKIFNTGNSTGISTFLIGKCSIEDIIKESGHPNLWIASAGPVPPNPAQLIESEGMAKLFKYAKENFDFIIVDTPPIALVSDALLLSKYADTNIFVMRLGYSFINSLDVINDLNKNKNVPDFNILINDAPLSSHYGYGHHYGHGYGYGYYGHGHSHKHTYGTGYYSDIDKPESLSFTKRLLLFMKPNNIFKL